MIGPSMKPPPGTIDGAFVVRYSPIDSRHRHTGRCKQIVDGAIQDAPKGLAICQYPGDSAYYLFGCDESWNCLTDTWHHTLQEALDQAEFEFAGVTATWVALPPEN
jgi:hypothetical protein